MCCGFFAGIALSIEAMRKWHLVLFVFIASSPTIVAQTDTSDLSIERGELIDGLLQESISKTVRVTTVGGGEFQGILLTVGEQRLELVDREGLILEVVTDHIDEATVIDEESRALTYYQDAAANKLLVIPRGFGMEPGEFHISDQEIVIVNASYGVSEHLSLWGALTIPGMLVNVRGSFLE